MLIKLKKNLNDLIDKKIYFDLIYYFFSIIIILFILAYFIFYSSKIGDFENPYSSSVNELISLILVFLVTVYAQNFRDNIFLKILIFFFFVFFIFRIPFSILAVENTIFFDRQISAKQLELSILNLIIQYLFLFISVFLINPKISQTKNLIINSDLINLLFNSLIILIIFNLIFNTFGDVSYFSYKKYLTVLNNIFNSFRLCLIFTILTIIVQKYANKPSQFYLKILIFYSLFIFDSILTASRAGFFYIVLLLFILFLYNFSLNKIKIKYLIISPILILILFLNFSISTSFKAYKTYKSIDKPYKEKMHIIDNSVAPLTGIVFESDKDWFIRFYKRNFFGNFQGISERIGYLDFYIEKNSNFEKYYKDKINLNYYYKPVIDRLSPGFDIFNVPFASKILQDQYNYKLSLEDSNKIYFPQATNSEQITIFAESQALFGYSSIIYYCSIFLVLNLFFYFTKNIKILLKDLLYGVVLISYFEWLTCFGLDMFVVLTLYQIISLIVIYYMCLLYLFLKKNLIQKYEK
tara:strand:+ start:463 stop:2031 length:1569 start_codon:yes stop_codon:yes gene_type:complete